MTEVEGQDDDELLVLPGNHVKVRKSTLFSAFEALVQPIDPPLADIGEDQMLRLMRVLVAVTPSIRQDAQDGIADALGNYGFSTAEAFVRAIKEQKA